MDRFIPDSITTAPIPQVFAAFAAAAPDLTRPQVLVLLAQSALETGYWKSCHCWNLGNEKHVEGRTPGSWTYFSCNEYLPSAQIDSLLIRARPRTDGHPGEDVERGDGVQVGTGNREVWFHPSHRGCRFRAFETLEQGAAEQVRAIRERFARAWPAVLSGDPDRFARELKARGYYTAPVDDWIDAEGRARKGYASQVLAVYRELDLRTACDDALRSLGYDTAAWDAAVRRFQRDRGLKPDGLVGPATRAAIADALEHALDEGPTA